MKKSIIETYLQMIDPFWLLELIQVNNCNARQRAEINLSFNWRLLVGAMLWSMYLRVLERERDNIVLYAKLVKPIPCSINTNLTTKFHSEFWDNSGTFLNCIYMYYDVVCGQVIHTKLSEHTKVKLDRFRKENNYGLYACKNITAKRNWWCAYLECY
jgi:hypothetical protein